MLVAEDILARRAAQHLTEINALQRARHVDRHRILRGIDGASEVDGAAIELSSELGHLEHAVAQGRVHVGIGHLEGPELDRAGLEVQRGIEGAQARTGRSACRSPRADP